MAFLARLRNSALFQRTLRTLQFLSAVISLGLFSSRLYKIITTTRRASHSNGAVEGILAAAVLYSLATMLVACLLKAGGGTILRWVQIVFDILFAIAFIIVTILTRPGAYSEACTNTIYRPLIPKGQDCNLPWGTFILGIVSTILHLITAIFHEVKDHRNAKKHQKDMEANGYRNGQT